MFVPGTVSQNETVSYEDGGMVRGWAKEDPVNHSKKFCFILKAACNANHTHRKARRTKVLLGFYRDY